MGFNIFWFMIFNDRYVNSCNWTLRAFSGHIWQTNIKEEVMSISQALKGCDNTNENQSYFELKLSPDSLDLL